MSDLISRAEVAKAIIRYENHFNTKLESLYLLINDIPSVSAERVGEWIYRGTFKFSNHYPKHRYECSECHQIVHLPLTEEAYHYCPNCGAYMKGGAE